MKWFAFVLFAATVPIANWTIGNIGECIPNGPCLIPVGFGHMAPSGVLIIGISLVLRDWLQELTSWLWSLVAIGIGAALSGFINPSVAAASIAAFALSESADLAIYSPLRKHGRAIAVAASGAVGAIMDSFLFLWLAFGSVAFWEGNTLGKIYASAIVAIILWVLRK